MNPDPNFRSLPRSNGNQGNGNSPVPPPLGQPRSTSSFLSGNVVIAALVALVMLIFVVTSYRIYVCVFWHRRRRALRTSSRHNHAEFGPLAGLDKAIIESLPAFSYKAPQDGASDLGLSECAVCLIEFEDNDSCRLLPKCRHSFHTECIDKWFLSHTTCPMCRMHPEIHQPEAPYHEDHQTGACLVPIETVHEHSHTSELRAFNQQRSRRMRKPRSQSTAFFPLPERILNDHIYRTRSDSLFGLERELEGLGQQLRQVLARTFSNGNRGNHDILQEETPLAVDVVTGLASSQIECVGNGHEIGRHAGLSAQKLHVQFLPSANWHRSASDKCLNRRQDIQLATSALSQSSGLRTHNHWQTGAKSFSHVSIDLPKLQDGGFPVIAAPSKPWHGRSLSEQPSSVVVLHLTNSKSYQSFDINQSSQVGTT